MAQVFLGLGGNLGDVKVNIRRAWQQLGNIKSIILIRLSNPYRTEPVGIITENWFVNAVGMIKTSLSPHRLLYELLVIEKEFGRDRQKNRDRFIDLDILYYEDKIVTSRQLVLPHPKIQNRLFVLAPLAELACDYQHPVLLQTTSKMMENLRVSQVVCEMSWNNNGEF